VLEDAALEEFLFEGMKEDQRNSSSTRYITLAKELRNRYSPAQANVTVDTSKNRAIIAPRRTGKSFWVGAELVVQCLLHPRSNCLYITLTKGSGRGILWGLLKQFNQEFDIKAHFHNTNLIMTFRNGSVIAFVGADNQGELDKIRGQGFDLVMIDECKSYPPGLFKELLKEVVGPALIDRMGRLCLVGTPGAILAGPFWEITDKKLGKSSRLWSERKEAHWAGRPYLWSVHLWELGDAALSHIKRESYRLKEEEGWTDDNPIWLREYMGKWVASSDALVYAYNRRSEGINNWVPDPTSANPHGLPGEHEWRYLLGIDLGFEDDFALVVAAYSDTCPFLYQVYDYKSPHLIIPEIAREMKRAEARFGEFEAIVGDAGGLGKAILATLEQQYGISVTPAEKSEKLDHIELLNSDLLSGVCKIRADSYLAAEMEVLQFDSSGVREHPGCANHACDAFLYLWRYSFHHYHRQLKKPLVPGTQEHSAMLDNKAYEKACERYRKRQEGEWWEDAADNLDDDYMGSDELVDLWRYLKN
jgi:hypothetical protein